MKFTGRNIQIAPSAKLGENVRVGDHSVIYDHVVIEDNVVIADNCVIGEPTSLYYSDKKYKNPVTRISKNSLIRSHTIVYAGVTSGMQLETGHRVTIRENTLIGNNCKIGTLCDLQGELEMGDHCQLHSSVHICQQSILGSYVFVYPFAVLTNDKYPPSHELRGPIVGDYSQIGTHAVLIAGAEVGEHSLVAANATVTKKFSDHSFLRGSPAKRISDVRNMRSDSGNPLYPWPQRFSRGMPWDSGGR